MLAWLAPIFVFGLVVFVHELGHFLAAKSVNVYVPRFSIGFGPALWKRRRGETQYMIGLLPLGGYVRMASREDEAMAFLEGGGEHPRPPDDPTTVGGSGAVALDGGHVKDEERPDDWDPNGLVPFGPNPVPPERYFESKSLPQRLIILIAGVAMNVALALGVQIGLHLQYGRPYLPPVVDSVLAGQPAQRAGVMSGDSILAVDGVPVRSWDEIVRRVGAKAGDTVRLDVVRRGGERAQLAVVPVATSVPDPITGEERQLGRIGAAARS
ncbi:MAG TPA: site-2 protease family protein, partial [Gemmatimonadaceae bacterium]|nr:site-2 protease family protein [Gemmatimonadaceae bacterium]